MLCRLVAPDGLAEAVMGAMQTMQYRFLMGKQRGNHGVGAELIPKVVLYRMAVPYGGLLLLAAL